MVCQQNCGYILAKVVVNLLQSIKKRPINGWEVICVCRQCWLNFLSFREDWFWTLLWFQAVSKSILEKLWKPSELVLKINVPVNMLWIGSDADWMLRIYSVFEDKRYKTQVLDQSIDRSLHIAKYTPLKKQRKLFLHVGNKMGANSMFSRFYLMERFELQIKL